MKRMRFVAAVVALSAVVAIPLAYAGGLWFGLPVYGGGTYCSATTGTGTGPTTGVGTGGTTTVCNTTVPAGPTTMTGNELVPADTNVSGLQTTYPLPGIAQTGANQTAYLPLANVASGAYQLVGTLTPSVTFTATVLNGVNTVYVNATGTQTYVAFQMPATPTDGQIIRFASAVTVSTVAFLTGTASQNVQTTTRAFALYPAGYGGGAGATVTGPFGVTMLWSAPINTWLRVQ